MTLPTSMAQLGRRQGSHLFRYYQGKINQRQFPQLYSAFHRGIDTCTDPLESSKDVVGHSHIHISSRNFSTANGKATTPTEETKEKKEPLSIPVTHEIDSDDDEPKNSGDANDDIDIDRSKFTHEIKIRMPDMGAGEGKVVHWFKKEGDIIKTGDTLCDIETPVRFAFFPIVKSFVSFKWLIGHY